MVKKSVEIVPINRISLEDRLISAIEETTEVFDKMGWVIRNPVGIDGEYNVELFKTPIKIAIEEMLLGRGHGRWGSVTDYWFGIYGGLLAYHRGGFLARRGEGIEYGWRKRVLAELNNLEVVLQSEHVQERLGKYYKSPEYINDYQNLILRYPRGVLPPFVKYEDNLGQARRAQVVNEITDILKTFEVVDLWSVCGGIARSDVPVWVVLPDNGAKNALRKKELIEKCVGVWGEECVKTECVGQSQWERKQIRVEGSEVVDLWMWSIASREFIELWKERVRDFDEIQKEKFEISMVRGWLGNLGPYFGERLYL